MTIISSGIYPINPTVTDGTQLAGYINELVAAINSQQASATRPPLITKGGLWTKTLTGTDIGVMVFNGSIDLEIAQVVDGQIIANFSGDINVNGVNVGRGSGDISNNTSVGASSLDSNLTGDLNSAFGSGTLQKNTTGSQNTAIGYATLQSNEYGIKNTAVGFAALSSTQYKDNSTAIGNNALAVCLQSGNTAVGSAALDQVILGSNNTAIGTGAGQKIELGSNNLLLGQNAQPSAAGVNNEVTIGNDNVTLTRLKGAVEYKSIANYEALDGETRIYGKSGVGATYDSFSHTFRTGSSGSTTAITISAAGNATFSQSAAFDSAITTNGSLYFKNLPNGGEQSGNVVVDTNSGRLYIVTPARAYTAEEVDKLLSAKDKVIKAMTERLDSLELKFKPLGSTKKGKK